MTRVKLSLTPPARNASVQGRLGIPIALGMLVFRSSQPLRTPRPSPDLNCTRSARQRLRSWTVSWTTRPGRTSRWPLDPWVSYNPLRGEPEKQRTSVWVAYDDDAIYFAFRCFDDEPGKIRTTITRRDNAWNDDWIAVSLDSSRAGPGRVSHVREPERHPDGCAATRAPTKTRRPTGCGRAPAASTHEATSSRCACRSRASAFTAAHDVRMGVLFFRHSSRMGVSWSWPAMRAGAMGVRIARAARLQRAAPAARPRGDPERHRLEEPDAGGDAILAGRLVQGRSRSQHQVRADLDDQRSTPPSTRTSARLKAMPFRSK